MINQKNQLILFNLNFNRFLVEKGKLTCHHIFTVSSHTSFKCMTNNNFPPEVKFTLLTSVIGSTSLLSYNDMTISFKRSPAAGDLTLTFALTMSGISMLLIFKDGHINISL